MSISLSCFKCDIFRLVVVAIVINCSRLCAYKKYFLLIQKLVFANRKAVAVYSRSHCGRWCSRHSSSLLSGCLKTALSVSTRSCQQSCGLTSKDSHVLSGYLSVFCLLFVLVKSSLLAKWLARKTRLRKPNCGEGIVSIKPRLKSVWLSWFIVFFHCFIA